MNIALVTNKQLHHKYWAYTLYKKHNVTLILHPHHHENLIKRIKSKKLLRYGVVYFIGKILSIIYSTLSSKSMRKQIKRNETIFYKDYGSKYQEIPKNIIHDINTVNSDSSIELIKKNNIDIICFLGGDTAKSDFISSARLASLNYHSGISPYYNGNKTIFHPVSDFRPNFAGGTLMYINENIDGGDILAHYLTPINKNDNAASLFMKGIIGAVKLYDLFLENISENYLPEGVKQERSFKYVRNIDWVINNDIKLRKFEELNRMRIYSREEKIIDYFDLKKDDISKIYQKSLTYILKK